MGSPNTIIMYATKYDIDMRRINLNLPIVSVIAGRFCEPIPFTNLV